VRGLFQPHRTLTEPWPVPRRACFTGRMGIGWAQRYRRNPQSGERETIGVMRLCLLALMLIVSTVCLGQAPVIHLKLDSVRFFESGANLTPKNERKYAVRFQKSSTRLIACELQLVHPQTESRVNFDIEAVWFGPGENLVHRHAFHTFVPPGSTRSLHATSWGCPEHPCRYWEQGVYRVDFLAGGTKVATGSFEIY